MKTRREHEQMRRGKLALLQSVEQRQGLPIPHLHPKSSDRASSFRPYPLPISKRIWFQIRANITHHQSPRSKLPNPVSKSHPTRLTRHADRPVYSLHVIPPNSLSPNPLSTTRPPRHQNVVVIHVFRCSILGLTREGAGAFEKGEEGVSIGLGVL